MNAVYFKATWTNKFDPSETRDETFTREDGQSSVMAMMHRKAMALFAPGEVYSTLCLPYGSGTNWQMLVMLPNEGKSVDEVVSSLSTTPWETLWQKNRGTYQVDIKIPRFSTGSEILLNDIIAQMGAPLMFSPSADFRQMTEDGEQLSISLLKQKAAIEVTEEGTKASAVTAPIASSMLPGQNVDFHADRPFVYVIREASSGAVFFIGVFQGWHDAQITTYYETFQNVQIRFVNDSIYVNAGTEEFDICFINKSDSTDYYIARDIAGPEAVFHRLDGIYDVCITKPGYIPYTTECGDTLYLQNITLADAKTYNTKNAMIGSDVTDKIAQGTVVINNGSTMVKASQGATITKNFQVSLGAEFIIRNE